MCDTLCVVDGERLLFAKNSDRPAGEVQLVERWPVRPVSRATLHTQYLDLGADPGAHASISSRPVWLWGFEHGLNEHGVAVGNEKIWTTDDPRSPEGFARHGSRAPRARARAARPTRPSKSSPRCSRSMARAVRARRTPMSRTTTRPRRRPGPGLGDRDEQHEVGGAARAARRCGDQQPGQPHHQLDTRVVRCRARHRRPDLARGRRPHRALPTAALPRTTVCISGLAPSAVQPGAVVATLRDHGTGPWGDPRGGGAPAPVPPPAESRDDGHGVTVCMHTRATPSR